MLRNQKKHLKSLLARGLEIPAIAKDVEQMQAGDFGAEWKRFRAKIGEGNSLWYFESPEEDWDAQGGRNGFLIADGEEVAGFYLLSIN